MKTSWYPNSSLPHISTSRPMFSKQNSEAGIRTRWDNSCHLLGRLGTISWHYQEKFPAVRVASPWHGVPREAVCSWKSPGPWQSEAWLDGAWGNLASGRCPWPRARWSLRSLQPTPFWDNVIYYRSSNCTRDELGQQGRLKAEKKSQGPVIVCF